MDENQIVTAIRALAKAFEGEGCVSEMAFDIHRIADALEQLAECVWENAKGSYFNISPDVD